MLFSSFYLRRKNFCTMQDKSFTGVMLKHAPLKEADEIITFWSWEQGKVRFLVRGVKKNESRLKGIFTPLSWLSIRSTKSQNLPVITGVEVVHKYPNAATRLESLSAAFNIFESVLSTTPDSQPNEEISLLLKNSLQYLNQHELETNDFLNSFRLKLMVALGYGLNTIECVECSKPAQDIEFFRMSVLGSGLLCDNCSVYFSDVQITDSHALRYITELREWNGKSEKGKLPKKGRAKATGIIGDFFTFLTERQMKSEKFLKENIIANIV
ncbi:MAG: DNA repair protein RecO [Candidatus Doudnabacteria bacterium RIFCSPHIGHO2_01_FULL_43_23]|uniref:DNA repair protein RecO n=1 Tax=Candidatus Doudnabacteria bacterium RIFCSPHIGHO2_01_FULL_43_23 TaxID=1817822 RepID=A0A1F5NVP0_9BACT|nr:MAG: DNA repair protein RecO [Candidatus Doudnabacteria bacterium RIFCSPHIGHO2_01_FULL_43_23]